MGGYWGGARTMFTQSSQCSGPACASPSDTKQESGASGAPGATLRHPLSSDLFPI